MANSNMKNVVEKKEVAKKSKNIKFNSKNKKVLGQKKLKNSKKQTKKTENKNLNNKSKVQVTETRVSKELKKASKPQKKIANAKPLHIIPLGGLGEIGKNMTAYEYDSDMIIVDCGMTFPDEEMLGIDIVIPDFQYVIKNADKIKGLVVTHAHEDHIGAIPYLLKNINVPVYGTALTIGLIEGKLKEHKLLDRAKLNVSKPGDIVKLGEFEVELIHVNHSIPDAVALGIKTPAGTVIQTGDFKIDTTPIDGDVIDLARFAEYGKEGVLALLSDSTNAERPGFTQSESIVGESFSTLFRRAKGKRIIVATFSSNIHRIQQIIDEAVACGRKVVLSGRSMENVVSVASELGYLRVPDGVLISIDMINQHQPERIVLITTGSQGEPMSALHRMAFDDHRKVKIVPGDFIIISATPIPGNEKTVSRVVNELMKLGAEVIYEKMYDVHVSGHACQEELKIMLELTKPKFFIPVHGEQKHLMKHAALGEVLGIKKSNILVSTIGNVIELTQNSMKITETVMAGSVLVDGLGVGDVGSVVLRDRKHLAEDGIFVVAISMDRASGEVVAGPDVISRGFIYVKESEEIINEAKEVACDLLERMYLQNIHDRNTIKAKVRDGVSRFLYERTGRSPMILPIIMDI